MVVKSLPSGGPCSVYTKPDRLARNSRLNAFLELAYDSSLTTLGPLGSCLP
jgi:hypothetical protein